MARCLFRGTRERHAKIPQRGSFARTPQMIEWTRKLPPFGGFVFVATSDGWNRTLAGSSCLDLFLYIPYRSFCCPHNQRDRCIVWSYMLRFNGMIGLFSCHSSHYAPPLWPIVEQKSRSHKITERTIWACCLSKADNRPISQGPWSISQLRHINCDCHGRLSCVDHDEYKIKDDRIRQY